MSTVREELLYWVEKYGERPAISYLEGERICRISYVEFVGKVVKLYQQIRSLPEDKVAIVGENSLEWMCHFYAALLAGKQTLLCDMLLPIGEMADIMRVTDTERVFLSPEVAELKLELQEQMTLLNTSMFQQTDAEGARESIEEFRTEQAYPREGCIVFMTSGTTGKAKGVVIDIPAFLYNNIQLAQVLSSREGDVVYSPLPMHHAYGVNKTFAFLHLGAELCLGRMRTVGKDILAFRPRILLVVPTVVEFLHKVKGFTPEVEYVIVSGCKCEKHVENICNSHGIFLQNIYGSSESSGGMALNLPGDNIDELTVIPGREVMIANDGEIILRTKGKMTCYYNAPEATKEKMQGDFLYTGDVGYLDERKHLHITGRKKDMIAMENGDKIYCEETDEMLSSLEGVEEAAVIYVHKRLIAAVFPEKGATEQKIRARIEQYNRSQQLIRRISEVWIWDQPLPRTSTGKRKRKELEDMYLEKRSNNGD